MIIIRWVLSIPFHYYFSAFFFLNGVTYEVLRIYEISSVRYLVCVIRIVPCLG